MCTSNTFYIQTSAALKKEGPTVRKLRCLTVGISPAAPLRSLPPAPLPLCCTGRPTCAVLRGCVCVCVSVYNTKYIHIHIHVYKHTYVYICRYPVPFDTYTTVLKRTLERIEYVNTVLKKALERIGHEYCAV
jgi:hypothetical protein